MRIKLVSLNITPLDFSLPVCSMYVITLTYYGQGIIFRIRQSPFEVGMLSYKFDMMYIYLSKTGQINNKLSVITLSERGLIYELLKCRTNKCFNAFKSWEVAA